MSRHLALGSLLVPLIVLLILHAPTTEQAEILVSVPDLQKAMYLNVDGYPCVRLLNVSGEIGCSNPGNVKIAAPIVKFKNADAQLSQPSTLLVSEDEMQSFFLRVSNDHKFVQNVAGVLVESQDRPQSSGFSPVRKFPQAEFATYKRQNYEWNPIGSGIMWELYNFPVFLLSKKSTLTVQEFVRKNGRTNEAEPIDVAEFDLVMQTTKAGTHDSESCLREHSCLPLGGYSVWSSLPPVNVTLTKQPKPLIIAMASQDSASFFRDQSIGADSPLSGLISLLAAVDALSHVNGLNELKKQLVFLIFTGEAWGYLGSRRFLSELEMAADSTKGLNTTLIEQVLEVGSVGKGFSDGVTTFFAHVERNPDEPLWLIQLFLDLSQEPQGSSEASEILTALEQADASLHSENIKVKVASTSNPGVPPSSLMSFLRKNSSTSGVVLEDFDTVFSNKFYHSHLDNPSNIGSSSIAAAASLVARTLYILANGDTQPILPVLNSIKVNTSLVDELVGCLLSCSPGLSCGLVKNFISPNTVCPNHYVGVFRALPTDPPSHDDDDTSRFVWNFLADRTSVMKNSTDSACLEGRCANVDEVCIGAEADGKGRCAISSTRYVPAYSTRLKFEGGSWRVMPADDASDPMGVVDPVWTESYWDTIGLRIYKAQSTVYDNFVLAGGIAVTILAYATVVATRAFFLKAVKHD